MDTRKNDLNHNSPDDFKLEIDLNSSDFHAEWKRCNMVANYLADFTAYEYQHREQAENLFSTIINELLEAVARLAAFKSVIRLALRPQSGRLSIRVEHECQAALVSHYTDFVQQISHQVGDSLYVNLLTEEDSGAPDFNQLGLAMIVHDFGGVIELEQRGDTPFMNTVVSIPTKEFAS